MNRPVLRLNPPTVIWVCWRPDSKKVRKAHTSYESALTEANRLAEIYPGKPFFVMESVKKVRRRVIV